MFLIISPQNTYAIRRLTEECALKGLKFEVRSPDNLRNLKLEKYSGIYIRNPFVFGRPDFLPQVIALAQEFLTHGKIVVDRNVAEGFLGMGKMTDYEKLKSAEILLPKTEWLEEYTRHKGTFRSSSQAVGFGQDGNIIESLHNMSDLAHASGLVLKWNFGLKGKGVYLVRPGQKINSLNMLQPLNEMLIQEYIKPDWEYKIVCIGFKAVLKALRFRPNPHGLGINFADYEQIVRSPHKDVFGLAEQAAGVLGREFCKVDIVEQEGRFYVLEVNRFPGLKSFEQLSGQNVFREFVGYLQNAEKIV